MALRTIQQLVTQQPGNAPALGYHAELLYMNGKAEEADDAIQKAFAINPDFPLGHWLRGMIRKDEGELVGALIEFRKAADLYDPKANDVLAEIHAAIFDIEMRMNRPVAARAALERAIHADPSAEPLRNAFGTLFSPESRLPQCAWQGYQFRPADASRTEAWKAALPEKEMSRLSEAAGAFQVLTEKDASDTAAWFNLGLVRAWLGDHPKAIEALQKSMELDDDLKQASETGALIEVLRCGAGMAEQSDYVEHRVFFQLKQPQPVVELIQEWQRNGRLSGAQSDPEGGTLTALILEQTPQFSAELSSPVAKLAASMMIVRNLIRLSSQSKSSVDKVADEMMQRLGGELSPPMQETGYPQFSEITSEAMLFPSRETQIEEIAPRLTQQGQVFFEETWSNRPLKSLSGLTPLDASAQPAYQKRLMSLVKFVEECYIGASPRVSDGKTTQIVICYDFNQLRRKLGLPAEGPAPVADGALKIDTLSVAELAALDAGSLTDEQLDQAYRTALQKDDRILAGLFARYLTNRPAGSSIADRYPQFNHLIQMAQAENDAAAVMALLEQGEKSDADANNGQRRNDYTLRKGQFLAKRGDTEQAYQVFQELLGRAPEELKFYGPAIEAMLGQKKGNLAILFAEQALAKARSQNNRDSEHYFMELAEAAKRQGG
ncbi:MAG: hypothetical protein K8T89_12650 [Planctomycetes bacterium]|nr:hypothetical protein [Planctomycetota bacterium]